MEMSRTEAQHEEYLALLRPEFDELLKAGGHK
jgi:hypothetical protein